MAYSTQRAVSDGTLSTLLLSIDYFDRSEISVYFNDLPAVTGWAWVGTTSRTLSFSPAIPAGVQVTVKRTSDLTKPRNVFSTGAQFLASTLDENAVQLLRVAQEVREGAGVTEVFQDFDVHGNRINNLADATLPGQAVTWRQYQADANGVGPSASAAAQSAANAAASAGQAMSFYQQAVSLVAGLASAAGATLLGYIFNATGAVQRTVAGKLGERIDSRDFGIVGDGSDESARVQAFFNAVAGKVGDFQPGLMVRCNSTVFIRGDATKIKFNGSTINGYGTGSVVDFALVGGTRYPYNVDIQDLSVNAYGANSYAFVPRTSYSTFRRVSVGLPVSNANGRGIVLIGDEANGTGPYYNTFTACDVQSSSLSLDHIGYSFVSVGPSFQRAPNANTFIGCRSGQCYQGWNIKGNGNVLYNPIAEGVVDRGTAFTFEATTTVNCGQNHIFGGYMEGQLVGISFSADASNNYVFGMFGTGIGTWSVDNATGKGNLVHTAIGPWDMPTGIRFPALSSDPKVLDYYGEGVYTPVPTGITVNSGTPVWNGVWTRVGNQITVSFKCAGGNISTVAGTSHITLPFAANAATVPWGVYGNNLVTGVGGSVGAYGMDLYFSSATTTSQLGGSITYTM